MRIPGVEEFQAQNYDQALPLLTKSAERGFAEAQCLLGNIYQLGLCHTDVDANSALQWYYRAAKQGYSSATQNLAGMIWPISVEASTALNALAQQQSQFSEARAS